MSNPRTPTALKVMRGTVDASRANPAEPKPKRMPANTPPPAWLDLSPTARRAWTDVSKALRSMGVATTVDPLAISLLCDALAEYVNARAVVRALGATYEATTAHGDVNVRARPEVAMAADAWRRARLMLNDYGLTAASRGKVSSHEGETTDPLAKWMDGSG